MLTVEQILVKLQELRKDRFSSGSTAPWFEESCAIGAPAFNPLG